MFLHPQNLFNFKTQNSQKSNYNLRQIIEPYDKQTDNDEQ